MHKLDWFISRVGTTIKKERIDLWTEKVITSYRFLGTKKAALDCFMTQDKYNTYMEKEKPRMHGYKQYGKSH